jgi:hypothetical protein
MTHAPFVGRNCTPSGSHYSSLLMQARSAKVDASQAQNCSDLERIESNRNLSVMAWLHQLSSKHHSFI